MHNIYIWFISWGWKNKSMNPEVCFPSTSIHHECNASSVGLEAQGSLINRASCGSLVGPRSCGAESRCTEWWDVLLLMSFLFFVSCIIFGQVLGSWFLVVVVLWPNNDSMIPDCNGKRLKMFRCFEDVAKISNSTPESNLNSMSSCQRLSATQAIISHTKRNQPSKNLNTFCPKVVWDHQSLFLFLSQIFPRQAHCLFGSPNLTLLEPTWPSGVAHVMRRYQSQDRKGIGSG